MPLYDGRPLHVAGTKLVNPPVMCAQRCSAPDYMYVTPGVLHAQLAEAHLTKQVGVLITPCSL